MRLIDADELKEVIEPYRYAICGFECVLALIDIAPTVEYTFEEAFQKTVCEQRLYCPERPKGEWIKHIDNLYPEDSTEECPFCHEEQRLVGNDDNFCPNCGADMRKEAENE